MKKIIFSGLISICTYPIASNAQEIGDELQKCSQVLQDQKRLQCYDSMVGKMRQNPKTGTAGSWEVNTKVNPMDDSKTVVALLYSESGRNSRGERPFFIARCKSNTTEAYIVWDDYLGDDSSSVYSEWKYVDIRVGSLPSQKQRWSISTDKEATFAPDWAGTLLKSMMASDRLVASTTPYNESPIVAVFDTSGMKTALKPLYETCGWTP